MTYKPGDKVTVIKRKWWQKKKSFRVYMANGRLVGLLEEKDFPLLPMIKTAAKNECFDSGLFDRVWWCMVDQIKKED